MLKNIFLLMLLVTIGSGIYYVYNYRTVDNFFSSETHREVIPPKYYYRIELKTGGSSEGNGIVHKKDSIDLIVQDRITITIMKSAISKIEKVFYETKKVVNVTNSELIKNVESYPLGYKN